MTLLRLPTQSGSPRVSMSAPERLQATPEAEYYELRFMAFDTIMVAGTNGSMQRASSFVEHLRQLHAEEFFMMPARFANALLLLMSLSVPASLCFLCQIHSKARLGATSQ